MNYYFITGTGTGIGKALASLLLQIDQNIVYGFSRSNEIVLTNFKYSKFDLNDLNGVKEFDFPDLKDAELIVLVNNSASMKEIIQFGKRSTEDIIESYNVNIVSPSILMNTFLKKYQNYSCKRLIMNISSGAAKMAFESWSTYCASKAALSMISEVINVEQKMKYKENPVYVFSVGPGIVDTQMQSSLRKTSPENFGSVGKFIEFKDKNQLQDPKDVAMKLYEIIKAPEKFETVSLNVKDI